MLTAAFAAAAILQGEVKVPPIESDDLGIGIQRTMQKLAASTAQKPQKVTIVFYGQSITDGQPWVDSVVSNLKSRFPTAVIDARNLAIAGFASQILRLPAEHDIYPLNPDLVVLHVYGGDREYEEILSNIRMRTTSEILMQTDHATFWPIAEPETGDKGKWWDWRMNTESLPRLAKQYSCGLAPVRETWVKTLRQNQLEPKDLLVDSVHLNERGNRLLGQIISQCFKVLPAKAGDTTIRRIPVKWKNGKFSASVYGTRVEIETATSTRPFFLQAKIDGQTPSQHTEAYAFTRTRPRAWQGPVMLTRVDSSSPLLAEDWKLTVLEATEEGKKWKFRVEGTVTGPDGEGWSDQRFVSKSKRVVIDPSYWYRTDKVPVGFEAKWSAYLNGGDSVTKSGTQVLSHGLRVGSHLVELTSSGAQVPAATLIVHQPPSWPKL